MISGILLLALALRLNGITFGLPYLYNHDENGLLDPTFRILRSGNLNPNWFRFPGSFPIYALCLWYGLLALPYYLIHTAQQGRWIKIAEFKNWLFDNPAFFYFSGRLLMCLLGLGSIYLVYLLCKRRFNHPIAGLAAFVLAIAPLHITYSRYIRPDIPGITLILLSIYLLDRHLESGKKKFLNWAAAVAGCATTTKYPFLLTLAPPFIYALYRDARQYRSPGPFLAASFRLQTLTAALFVWFALGFFITAPFLCLHLKTAFYQAMRETRSTHLSHESLPGLQNFVWYLEGPLQQGIGGLFFQVLAVLGFWRLLNSRKYQNHLLFLVFPVLFFLLIGNANLKWSRWALPILPFEAIFFAVGFHSLYKFRRGSAASILKITPHSCLLFLFILCALLTIKANWVAGNFLRKTDTRTLTKQWVEENLPQGAVIAYEKFMPPLHVRPSGKFRLVNTGWWPIVSKPLDYYKNSGVNYLIIIDEFRKRYYDEPGKYRAEILRYEAIATGAKLVKRIANDKNPGPVIEIYQL